MNIHSFVILLAAIFLIIYGLAFSLAPSGMSLIITGSEPYGVSALVDFRATYGGMTVAVGISLIYLRSINQIRPSLIIIIVILLSMAISRTLGLLLDGADNYLMYLYLIFEIAGSALCFFALRKVPCEPK